MATEFVNDITVTGIVSAIGGTSINWNNAYTTIQSNSASWSSGGNGVDTGVRELTGNWQDTYSWVSSNSANASFTTLTAQNITTQDRVQYLSAGVVAVYQYYNLTTNSLDTVFV